MKESLVKVLTIFAGFAIIFAVVAIMFDVGLGLLGGLLYVIKQPELVLAFLLFLGTYLFARNIGPSFDKLFEK